MRAQSTNRPVTGIITQVITAVTSPGTVSQAFGNFLIAGYNYVNTNGAASVGLGNTYDQLGKGKVAPIQEPDAAA